MGTTALARRGFLAGLATTVAGCTEFRGAMYGEPSAPVSLSIKTTPADNDSYAIQIARHLAKHLEAVGIETTITPLATEELLHATAEPATLLRIILLVPGKQVIELGQILNALAIVLDRNRVITIIHPDIQVRPRVQRVLNRLTHHLVDVTTSMLLNPARHIDTEDITFLAIRHHESPPCRVTGRPARTVPGSIRFQHNDFLLPALIHRSLITYPNPVTPTEEYLRLYHSSDDQSSDTLIEQRHYPTD